MTKLSSPLASRQFRTAPKMRLGDLGTITRGKRFVKLDIVASGVPCIHYGEIYTSYGVSAQSAISFLDPGLAKGLRRASHGDVIIASAGETVEDIGKAVAWLGDEDVVIHDACYAFRSPLDPKFVAYFLRTNDFHSQVRKHVMSSKVSSVSTQNLAKVRIPVPSIEVQREVSRLLDAYTDLQSALQHELEGELAVRQTQYLFLRDRSLDFREVVDMRTVTLGDFGTFFGGLSGKTKADFTGGSSRFVSYVNILRNPSVEFGRDDFVRVEPNERRRSLQKGDILFTGSSETPNDVGMSSVVLADPPEPLYLNSFSIGYRLNEPEALDPSFAKHLFRSSAIRHQIVRSASGVTRFNLSKSRLGKVQIPLPTRSEQLRIAATLDELERSIDEIRSELQHEVAARKAQYRYYLNKLLTFEEAPA